MSGSRQRLVSLLLATLMSGAAASAFALEPAQPNAGKAPVVLFEDAGSGLGSLGVDQGRRFGPRAALADGGETASVTYFTPRLSGVGALARWSAAPALSGTTEPGTPGNVALGLAYDEVLGSVSIRADMAGVVARGEQAAGLAETETYGPRAEAAGRDWKIGAALGYASMELGASLSEGGSAKCGLWGSCSGSTLDVGLAYRFGAGSVAAGYTAAGGEVAPDGRSIYSLSADYTLAPQMDLYGGMNWVDIDAASRDDSGAVFLLGTNVRF